MFLFCQIESYQPQETYLMAQDFIILLLINFLASYLQTGPILQVAVVEDQFVKN